MELQIQQKVQRFIELSKKFSLESKDIFEPIKSSIHTMNIGDLCINGCDSGSYTYTINNSSLIEGRKVYIDEDGIVKAKDNKPLSRAESILAEATIQAQLSNDFDEYKELQLDLEEYFTALNKLT
tara:strand:- start:45 stop:419 length:375 start_codon:yes stop_codon:yes gene_type:complete